MAETTLRHLLTCFQSGCFVGGGSVVPVVILMVCFEARAHYVAQAGLEFTM